MAQWACVIDFLRKEKKEKFVFMAVHQYPPLYMLSLSQRDTSSKTRNPVSITTIRSEPSYNSQKKLTHQPHHSTPLTKK